MSTPFYDLASLVVVPSGYKASKVYAQKPLTTDGQLTFSRASTATRVNSAGLIETVSSNVPRLDYLGSTCPKLQLEPQRSNLALHNSAFDNAVWNKNNTNVTANQAVSPDGATNADKLVENSSSSFHDTNQQSITYTAAAYTISVFAKAAGRNHIFLQIFDGVTFYTSGTFNLSNGTVSGSGSIVSYGNGWYRCSFTATTASSSGGAYINLSNGTSGNYQGDGTSGVFVYGAQLELGAYSTSLIQTTTAAVTRLADECSKTGISSLIGQASGTFFVDITFGQNENPMWYFSMVGTDWTTDSFYLENTASKYIQVSTVKSGAGAGSATSTVQTLAGSRAKIAVQYSGSSLNLFVNGVKFSGARSANPLCSKIYLNEIGTLGGANSYKANRFNQVLTFTSALTDAQCIELTTL